MANGADPDLNQANTDLCKLQFEEYRSRYESMRSLEWKVLFQTYAGYTAIAIAFQHAKQNLVDGYRWLFPIAVTLTFFVATQYLTFRIQERLLAFGVTYENWSEKIKGLIKADIGKPGPGTSRLGHPFFWTYDIQLFLALLTCAGLLGYEAMCLKTLDQHPWIILGIVLAALAYTLIIRCIAKIIHGETLRQYQPQKSEPTIWKDFMKKRKQRRKESGTQVTAPT